MQYQGLKLKIIADLLKICFEMFKAFHTFVTIDIFQRGRNLLLSCGRHFFACYSDKRFPSRGYSVMEPGFFGVSING